MAFRINSVTSYERAEIETVGVRRVERRPRRVEIVRALESIVVMELGMMEVEAEVIGHKVSGGHCQIFRIHQKTSVSLAFVAYQSGPR